jgi:hypothetical protein
MARCGCASSGCQCVVQAGANVTVTGDGSTASPYIINATTGVTTVADTSTIDHTLTGAGTPASPYLLQSAVKISAESGNLITANADGLSLTCDDVAACAVPASITTGCGLDGTGALADPLLVKGLIPWPFACPESNAGDLYCGADGSILAAPPQTCINAQVGLGPTTGMAGFCGLVPVTATRTRLSTQPNRLTFTNTDPCRNMQLDISAAGVIQIVGDGTDGTNPNQYTNQLLIGLMIDGVTGAVVQQIGIYGNNGQLDYAIDYPPIILTPGQVMQIGSFVDGQADVACHVENSTFQHPNIIVRGRTCA